MQLYWLLLYVQVLLLVATMMKKKIQSKISLANLQGTWDMIKCYGWEYDDNNQKENWTEDVSGEYIFFEDTDGNGGYSDGSHTYYFASSINGNKLILRDSGWLAGKSITITKLTKTELHITATDENSEENYEMIKKVNTIRCLLIYINSLAEVGISV